jgi:hypothetical protein
VWHHCRSWQRWLLASHARFLSTRSALSLVLAFALLTSPHLTSPLLSYPLAAYYIIIPLLACRAPRLHDSPLMLSSSPQSIALFHCFSRYYFSLRLHPASMTTCSECLLVYSHSTHFRDRTFLLGALPLAFLTFIKYFFGCRCSLVSTIHVLFDCFIYKFLLVAHQLMIVFILDYSASVSSICSSNGQCS